MNYLKYKMDDYIKVGDDGRKVLGVDIQPEKACIFDCIVCNRGRTKYQGEWHDFGPIEDSLEDLKKKIAEDKPDLVEIYGQGDILTNVHLEDIINCVHALGLPVRLVTNCYLLGIGEHMRVANLAEEVVGAFGIVEDEAFKKYHRPLPELEFTPAKQTESIIRFSQQYQGKFKLRVFLSQNFNDSDESVAVLKAIVDRVKFDSLWVASTNKLAVPDERVAEITKILNA
ncbi:hypothetical protein [uncultured Dysosmobacter sp.]|uniref:hypothetical protein n=1 Tax=uncultured Dysosmobacter sp. TaxID=2591384 RepID=UPI002632DD1E|nr:hypothetical protein [uncultured Dysosmobacter sp.]